MVCQEMPKACESFMNVARAHNAVVKQSRHDFAHGIRQNQKQREKQKRRKKPHISEEDRGAMSSVIEQQLNQAIVL